MPTWQPGLQRCPAWSFQLQSHGYNLPGKNKMIVFITGASAGFGAAMARTFVKNGHQVVLAARRKDRLDALARELGESALPIAMDVTDKNSIEEAL